MSKKISQQKLEFMAGISKNQVGNIERGEVNVTLATIVAICSALEITPEKLFTFGE